MTEQEALIALNMVPDVGSARLKNLLEAFGSAPKIFLNSEEKLKQVEGIGVKIARSILGFSFGELKKELDLARKLKVKIVTLADPDYPENLKEIYGAPLCLYLKGELVPGDKLSLAIVGSRRASFYGLSCAERFAYSLADMGVTIVSGLARGVDTQAHKGALKAKGRTIAVLGSGLNRMYPPENKGLAEEIADSGAVVSEFPLNAEPQARNFPRRNRLISGLSLGVIVAEAAKNSGALITADFALEQGREVFAIPGKVDSATSFGANQLIKQGAKLVDSIEDILEELNLEKGQLQSPNFVIARSAAKRSDEAIPSGDCFAPSELAMTASGFFEGINLSDEEKAVLSCLCGKPVYVDEIIEKSGLSSARIMALLLKLEMQGLIKQFPGKMFAKKE